MVTNRSYKVTSELSSYQIVNSQINYDLIISIKSSIKFLKLQNFEKCHDLSLCQ